MSLEERRQRRLMRNRQAAKECRQKKKNYVSDLEQRLRDMEQELMEVERENEELRVKLGMCKCGITEGMSLEREGLRKRGGSSGGDGTGAGEDGSQSAEPMMDGADTGDGTTPTTAAQDAEAEARMAAQLLAVQAAVAAPQPPIPVPDGHVIFDKYLVSEPGFKILESLLEGASNRNPDAQGVYLYNDYYGYALVRAYGAATVTVLNALSEAGTLTPTTYPALETTLKTMIKVGDSLNNIEEDLKLEAELPEKWAKFRAPEDADQDAIDELLDQDSDGETWVEFWKKAAGDAAKKSGKTRPKKKIKTTGPYNFKTLWPKYKKRHGGLGPLKGPGEWDLTKWSEKDRKKYSLDNLDDEE
ncbi:hypothetical protein HK104_006575 [Borealophlyctis nickersoniae]|nr:hypothetical protein HK104_006575 [Borealophlyctis nickersoniae]